MIEFKKLLEKILLSNFKNLYKHALEHALVKNPSEVDKIQALLNIQFALESLAKVYKIRKDGPLSILRKNQKEKTEIELIDLLEKGELYTISISGIKNDFLQIVRNEICEDEWYSDIEKKVVTHIQNLRNNLVHLGLQELPEYVMYDILQLSCLVINKINWQESMYSYCSENQLDEILGPELFSDLVNHPDYFDLSCDSAIQISEEIHNCFICGNESFGLLVDDYYFCFSCGYKIDESSIGFKRCPLCGFDELIYDTLNSEVSAKCVRCGYKCLLFKCKKCGEFLENVNKLNICEECASDM